MVVQVTDSRGRFRNCMTQPAYNGVKDVLRIVYNEGGVRALYRGIGMYLLAKLCSLYTRSL